MWTTKLKGIEFSKFHLVISIRLQKQERVYKNSGVYTKAKNSKFLERTKPWIETGVQ
jgi:hypothetical protein